MWSSLSWSKVQTIGEDLLWRIWTRLLHSTWNSNSHNVCRWHALWKGSITRKSFSRLTDIKENSNGVRHASILFFTVLNTFSVSWAVSFVSPSMWKEKHWKDLGYTHSSWNSRRQKRKHSNEVCSQHWPVYFWSCRFHRKYYDPFRLTVHYTDLWIFELVQAVTNVFVIM